MRKGFIAIGLATVLAGLGLENISALSSNTVNCNTLKTTLSQTSTDTGSATLKLSENCTTEAIYIKKNQSITFDPAGHTLTANIIVETGGTLTIASYSTPGVISGTITSSGKVSITGGSFSVDPTDYLAEGYTATLNKETGLYVVSEKSKESSSAFDTSKVVSQNASLRNALIATLENQAQNPDDTTENGRNLSMLLNSVKLGNTITAELVVTEMTELPGEVGTIIYQEVEGLNLATVNDIKLVVNDSANSKSVYLDQLSSKATAVIAVPDIYRSALASRGLRVVRIHENSSGEYESETISSVRLNSDGNAAFDTDRFSYFALAYDGEPITAYMDDDIAVPSTSAGNVTTPDTAGFSGLELTVFHLLMLIGISFVVIALIAYAAKRAYIRNKISLK